MSFVDPLSIQTIAHSVDVTGLSDDAAKALAPDVEYRLREVVQEALKFARHSKRTRLTAEDVTNALVLRNVEPVYGFAHKDPGKFARAAGHSDVFFVQDRELTFEQVIEAALPKPPIEIGVKPHWLVIEGVQPVIPENASLDSQATKRRKVQPTTAPTAQPPMAGQAANPTAAAAVKGAEVNSFAQGMSAGLPVGTVQGQNNMEVDLKLPVKHLVSLELQVYFTKMCQLLRGDLIGPGPWAVSTGEMLEGPPQQQQAESLGLPQETPEQRQQQQQLKAALASLATDPGLQQLAPYLSQFLAAEVGRSLKLLPRLTRLLAAISALLSNPHIDLEPYLGQLLPPILTCMVAKNLGGPSEDHWSLRDRAAMLAAAVCARYAAPVYNIQPRVLRTLLAALLDGAKPMPVHYGAIRGLAALGPRVVSLLLLPNLEPLVHRLAGQPPAPPRELPPPHGQTDAAGAAAEAVGEPTGTLQQQAAAVATEKPQPPQPQPPPADAAGTAAGAAEAAPPPLHNSREPSLQYQAWRCWGAIVEAVGASAYHRVISAAAQQLPEHLLRPRRHRPDHAAEAAEPAVAEQAAQPPANSAQHDTTSAAAAGAPSAPAPASHAQAVPAAPAASGVPDSTPAGHSQPAATNPMDIDTREPLPSKPPMHTVDAGGSAPAVTNSDAVAAVPLPGVEPNGTGASGAAAGAVLQPLNGVAMEVDGGAPAAQANATPEPAGACAAGAGPAIPGADVGAAAAGVPGAGADAGAPEAMDTGREAADHVGALPAPSNVPAVPTQARIGVAPPAAAAPAATHGTAAAGATGARGRVLAAGGSARGASTAAAAGANAPVAGARRRVSRPVRAVLADAWREDADMGEQLEALAELLGEPMLAMLPSPLLSSYFL